MIKIRKIPNIMDANRRSVDEVQFKGDRLRDYIEVGQLSPEMSVVADGVPIPYAERHKFEVKDGMEIILTPEVKDPATLGLLAMAAFAGASVTSGWVAISLAVVGVAASVGQFVMMGNRTAPRSNANSMEDSPTYSWDGIQSQSAAGVPVPIIYGRHLTGGNIVSAYVENFQGHSYLNLLYALCEGPVDKIGGLTKAEYEQSRSGTTEGGLAYSGTYDEGGYGSENRVNLAVALAEAIGDKILIDDTPISDFVAAPEDAPIVKFRYGHNPQSVVPFHSDPHHFRSFNVQLIYDTPQEYTMETDDAETIALLFETPSLYKIADSGRFDEKQTEVEIYIKESSEDDSEYELVTTFYMRGQTNAPLRDQYRIEGLDPGNYTIKLIKSGTDSSSTDQSNLYLRGIDEIKSGIYTYPYTALVGMRLKATGRIRGGLPSVKMEVDGRIVKVWDPSVSGGGDWVQTWTRNNIWCIYDLLSNSRYGVGDHVVLSTLERMIERWKANAAHCDEEIDIFGVDAAGQTEPRYQLDIVVDSRMKALDLIQMLAATCQAMTIHSAGAIYPVIDKAEEPVAIFGMGNIERGSFSTGSTSLQKSPNLVEIEYYDRDNLYEKDPVEAIDNEALQAGAPIRRRAMNLIGVTRRSQALRHAAWNVRDAKYNVRRAQFRAGSAALRRQAGDVIGVSNDLPQWGQSGRLTGATSTSAVLNRSITIPALASGESFLIKVVHSADDTIEERVVSLGEGTYAAGASITIATPWTTTPSAYDTFSVGVLPVKPFRILSMKRNSETSVMLSCVEHNPEVYDLSDVAVTPPNYSSLQDPRRVPPKVVDLSLTNTSAYNRSMLVGWRLPDNWGNPGADEGFVSHYEVWFSNNGSAFQMAGSTDQSILLLQNTIPGHTYRVRVVTVSKWDVKTPFPVAPEATLVAKRPSECSRSSTQGAAERAYLLRAFADLGLEGGFDCGQGIQPDPGCDRSRRWHAGSLLSVLSRGDLVDRL